MRKTLHWILNFTNFLKNISFLPWWWLPFIHQLIHMLQWVRVRIYKLRRLHDGRSAEFKSEVTALFVFLYLCICMFLYFCICVFVYVQYVNLCICQSVLSAELQSGVTGGRRWMDRPSSADRSSIHSLLPCPPSPSLSLSLILATRHTLCHRPVCHRGRGRGRGRGWGWRGWWWRKWWRRWITRWGWWLLRWQKQPPPPCPLTNSTWFTLLVITDPFPNFFLITLLPHVASLVHLFNTLLAPSPNCQNY